MASSLVNNKYRITRRIGGGSFGEIYMGVGPNNEKVAVKFERHGTRCPQLRHEYKVYRELTNCHGFCSVYHFGTQDNYNVMVMDLLGPSLEDLFNKCSRRFSLKTVLQIADQMLERADTLHSRHLIHRDVKPANFVIGVQETAANVFCVDFGLSKRYRHPKNLHHIPHRDGRSLTGTPRYASINNHLGIEQSRRDDLESIGYVLIYFLKGTLPWQGLKAKNAQKKYRLILEKKQQATLAQLRDADLLLLLQNQAVLFLGVFGLQSLPGQGALEEVDQHIADALQVIAAALLDAWWLLMEAYLGVPVREARRGGGCGAGSWGADTLHSRHLIHRDVKPANFVIGVQETAANVFCVDFGLSKRYRHPKNLHHIPHRDGRSLTGTPRYASINNHLGIEQSRRDDLESIGYVLIYFLKGTLPWQGLKAKNAQKKYRLILEKKQQVSIAQLCQGCPSQFAEFLAYTRSL
eukprot:CAMPEP_0173371094 /NCGR_PEP_ID=MMETSP1144-20121109/27082_1 /TAXON_ID=483371 /ORGANISM="non described non described, Strain CCMP2298" /LENGTH=463 /DNA_ID=CAMNT_0014322781 /DNA_START=171 /DNA_END=1561 /DNA_ORIENTATION=-